ncbi:glycoside hydrolase 43 family protein [Gracilibacillus caseinilyticus]|uniref:Glycoside hydrolase 43 family protein n=1 Tax=Gracilibacillus caseinilyticus TaxID=2932256 RepID=A0ABY4EWW2_9BACI|nr:glycoside hydrolase 43 family protein [Gracilibacillus caseinilyticus]UOQ48907.1 glycoside hydrolase 43 family protein [Gracilibacillus caseinilyticus]
MQSITLHNPIFWSDVPDVDVIRVGDAFYMVSTSMHSMPGCPIMKSVNLRDWEIISYVYDTLEDNPAHRLQDQKGIYGQGQWATSLRFHNDTFYLCFSSNDMQQFYVYQSKDIENGPWTRSVIDGIYHDPALLFDNDSVYVIYGCGDIRITELNADLSDVKSDGIDQLLLKTPTENIGLRCEGCHAYKINGEYYLLFIEWPTDGNQRRRQVCYRSKKLLGEYQHKIILDDDMGYHNKGIAQGAIFDTPHGDWYAMLFQDHDAVGRIPCVLPVHWQEGWPMIGEDGKAPEKVEIPLPDDQVKPLVISDDFDYQENKLALNWQWNHNPNNSFWSVTEKQGVLRLKTDQLTKSVLTASNTLTQRTEGPKCSGSIRIHTSNMKVGDHAGLVALQNNFGTVGIYRETNDHFYMKTTVNDGNGQEKETMSLCCPVSEVYLKIVFDYEDSRDLASFYYSANGVDWRTVGEKLPMKYTLDHFMGYRVGIFYYATEEAGGSVDVDFFQYEKGIHVH